MCDQQKLEVLKQRLNELELRIPAVTERPIVEVARIAILEEITAIGHRLQRRGYWRGTASAIRAAG